MAWRGRSGECLGGNGPGEDAFSPKGERPAVLADEDGNQPESLSFKPGLAHIVGHTARTMSQENVEIVRRLYGFWGDRDLSAIEDAIHPDAVIDVSRNVFNPGTHHGIDGVRHFLAQIDEVWEDFKSTPEEFIDAGDKIVVAHVISGKGRGSGVEAEMRLFVVIAFRDDKILRFTGGFRNRDEAVEAAGLRE